MVFAKNLQYLRKRDKITQEELAERIGVSRQSVSKWETGEAYPETDKLILLCDLFAVSLDALLRTDLSAETAEITEPAREEAGEVLPAFTDETAYALQMDRFSRGIAFGVFLVLFGVAACMTLTGVACTLGDRLKSLTEALSGVAVLLFVAAAVFLFAFSGIGYDKFRKAHPVMGEVFSEQELRAFGKRFAVALPALVSAILLDAALLITFISLVEAEILKVFNQEAATCYFVAAFLCVLAFLVGALVYFGIQHGKYHVSEYNKQNEQGAARSQHFKVKEAICGSVMMAATAIYFVLGFVCGWWHPGWVVFPVGGIICGIVDAIFKAKGGKE